MDEKVCCPVCKTDSYLNPNLQLLVSPCYHKMCEACVNRIFGIGAAPCPICRMTLRKTNFQKPIFESVFVEKECQVRKRINKMFVECICAAMLMDAL
jgi:CDK-activating kinase assembly factor MAT1